MFRLTCFSKIEIIQTIIQIKNLLLTKNTERKETNFNNNIDVWKEKYPLFLYSFIPFTINELNWSKRKIGDAAGFMCT